MPHLHEWMFYEVMWRLRTSGRPYPFPWWVQQYFRHWTDFFDAGLFDSKEAAFASNANYRYWSMIGEPGLDRESLVGQAGEIEPVYDEYAVSAFTFDPAARTLHFPQAAGTDGRPSRLRQALVDGWKPVVRTTYEDGGGLVVEQTAYATRAGPHDDRVWVQVRIKVTAAPAGGGGGGGGGNNGAPDGPRWLCVLVSPLGPTGFQRHDRAGRFAADRRLTFLRYLPADRRVEVNATWGPSFDRPPAHFGLYGNGGSEDPQFYLDHNPFNDLTAAAALNGRDTADDQVAGLCHGVFAWPVRLDAQNPEFRLEVMLPVGGFDTADELPVMSLANGHVVGEDGVTWNFRLLADGLQLDLPPGLRPVLNQYKTSLAHLVILADHGAIHPGPTIYDSFWIRDSSVEGVAAALAGQEALAEAQFGTHYKHAFHRGPGHIGPVALHGFFGHEHERNDREWDSNGQALWAIGRFDRIKGPAFGFGQGMFNPYVLDGARWIRDNRSPFGLLHDGWSAEHLGDKNKPHYWDDLWAAAGLYEAARLAERIGAPQTQEIWDTYDAVRTATADSIRWVLERQRQMGFWETFVPTGPADAGLLDSTIIGAVAYFHPCRLYIGNKLGDDVDRAMRLTLETIWGRFIQGGFCHDSAWNCFGPYLTLQLAHAFLLVGQLDRMDALLGWSLDAANATVSRGGGAAEPWQVVLGAWNEQHCYPVATDFRRMPDRPWYMGDMPHGWACAEVITLLRDMMFFEADEDGRDPHIYLLPGVLPGRWGDGERIRVTNGRTVFGGMLDFDAAHDAAARTVTLDFRRVPRDGLTFAYECRHGRVAAATADGLSIGAAGDTVRFPGTARSVVVRYAG